MRIGIISGTFDPIHDGHVDFARQSISRLKLDELIFMPEPSPRNKPDCTGISDRIRMLKIAIENIENATIHRSHTKRFDYDGVMRELNKLRSGDAIYYLLMGYDVFKNIDGWQEVDKVLDTFKIIVSFKSSADRNAAIDKSHQLGKKVTLLQSGGPDISSSKIRRDICADKKPEGINPRVLDYIYEKGLYVCR